MFPTQLMPKIVRVGNQDSGPAPDAGASFAAALASPKSDTLFYQIRLALMARGVSLRFAIGMTPHIVTFQRF